MPKPRYRQVSLEATPYYHCVSRCVRRAFLCGMDKTTGQDYEHRRQWIEYRMLELGQIFAIDICAYAIMNNHYHVVLHVDQLKAEHWSLEDVIRHWHMLFSGTLLSQRYLNGASFNATELQTLRQMVRIWRQRLMDISWFMRVLNEGIARQANAEDDCSGRFWEGRFKSQALLDEAALAACMAYVDLNPIRARMAKLPETSDYTSIQRRIRSIQQSRLSNAALKQPRDLLPFTGHPNNDIQNGLPFKLADYMELVDWTGRLIRNNKHGSISQELPAILSRLQIEPRHWLHLSQHYESTFKGLVGSLRKLKRACELLGYHRQPGYNTCSIYFP